MMPLAEMTPQDWIAAGAFALTLFGALAHIVWKLSSIDSRMETLTRQHDGMETDRKSHESKVWAQFDAHRTRIEEHESRITVLESRMAK